TSYTCWTAMSGRRSRQSSAACATSPCRCSCPSVLWPWPPHWPTRRMWVSGLAPEAVASSTSRPT
ncbi:BRR2A, partial [Symbiodinium pilosum]